MSVPNQRKIYIKRDSDKARLNFFKVSNKNLLSAMYNLKPSAFKLWVYFTDNTDGYSMDLYPVDFCKKANISESTYKRAFQELIDKGYLIQSEKSNNLFLFKELSDKVESPDVIQSVNEEDFNAIIDEYFN